jgi:hypothetical protein
LKLGVLAGVLKDARLSAWDLACNGSPARDAITLWAEVLQGRELKVSALEIQE